MSADTAGPRGATQGLARDNLLNLSGAVVSQVCNFGVVFALARLLGTAAVGGYSNMFAGRALLLLVCGLGTRVAMTKFVASAIARDDPAMLRGSVRLGMWSTGVLSAVAAAAIYVLAEPIAGGYLDDPSLVLPVRLAALSLPLFVVMTTALAATQGFSTMRPFAGIGMILEPGLRLALTLVAIVAGLGVVGAVGALTVASVVAAVAAVVALRRLMARMATTAPTYPVRELSAFGAYSWLASIANQGLLWADIIILGGLVSLDEVGVYQVATRVVLLATFVVTPLTASLAPRVTDLWERGEREQLARQFVDVTSLTWRLSLPVLALVAAAPVPVLRIFGDGFADGRNAALLLLVGALGETLAAPSAVVLNQIGRNGLNMVINLVALALNIVGNFVLVPLLGIEGAAVAWAAALVLPGLARVVAVRRLATGVWPWSRAHGAALVAAATAVVLGRGAVALLAGASWLVHLVVAGTVVGVTYVVLGLVLGAITSGERRTAVALLPGADGLLLRARTRRLQPPPGPVSLRRLISPHRPDVLVRAGFFELARAHRDLVVRDPEAFIALARASEYHGWFRDVAVDAIGLDPTDEEEVERAFDRRVRRSLDLLQRWEAHGGFDARFPVTVREVPAGVPLGGRTLDERWLLPVDGGHRLALAWLDGVREVPAHWLRLDPAGELRGNTTRLASTLGWDRAQHSSFLGMGLLDDDAPALEDLQELHERLAAAGSPLAGTVATWRLE